MCTAILPMSPSLSSLAGVRGLGVLRSIFANQRRNRSSPAALPEHW
jgi:hypothetical protein